MTEHQHIEQQGIQDFFAMIPNLVDDADLDVYEFRLLVHYYRVGNCWQSTNTTAVICHMSKPQVVEKRRSLAGKGWIKIIKGDAQDSLSITVIDKWDENHKRYAGLSKDTPPHMAGEKSSGKPPDQQGVTQINGTGQDVVPKNIPVKKNPIKNTPELSSTEPRYVPEGQEFEEPKPKRKQIIYKHPALKAYRAEFGIYVRPAIEQEVVDTVGDAPADLIKWQELLHRWNKRGYLPSNLDGLLDAFKNGGLQSRKPDTKSREERINSVV